MCHWIFCAPGLAHFLQGKVLLGMGARHKLPQTHQCSSTMADPLGNELDAPQVGEPPLVLSALPDDVLIRLLATAQWEEIAALACVAKRYANVCERAGWACAARRPCTMSLAM